jgi:RHS repeat-associated protein
MTEPPSPGSGNYGVTSVTVSGTGLSSGAAALYADATWARTNATPANGNNTYTATAVDNYPRTSTDSVTVFLPSSVSYLYDARGNLTNDGLRSFQYDSENQLTNVSVAAAWRSDFIYDGLQRRRIRKEYTWSGGTWVETNEVRYIYDRNLVIQERDANNLPTLTLTRGNDLSATLQGAGGVGGLLARTDMRLLTINDPQATAYFHCDGNGNITALVYTNGVIAARYGYDPFGNTLSKSGPLADANLYRFSSKEWHPSSGLVYYGRRFYDPNLQRWVNRDPIEESGGINLYCALDNTPTLELDSWGNLGGVDDVVEDASLAVGLALLTGWAFIEAYSHNPYNNHGLTALYPCRGGDNAIPTSVSMDKSEAGVIYVVPGKDTPSGKDYVGRTSNPKGPPGRGKSDGRDRTDAKAVDKYKTREEAREKEQQAIDDRGGVKDLDNKRNEIDPKKCPE